MYDIRSISSSICQISNIYNFVFEFSDIIHDNQKIIMFEQIVCIWRLNSINYRNAETAVLYIVKFSSWGDGLLIIYR